MSRTRRSEGFSLIELLLVLAIIGIISAIAIPSFMSQRRRARMLGDAKANASVLRMQLESRKADAGVYGTPNTYTWTAAGSLPSSSTNPAPSFTVNKSTTKMNYYLTIGSTGLTYSLLVKDTTLGNASVYIVTQTGSETVLVH